VLSAPPPAIRYQNVRYPERNSTADLLSIELFQPLMICMAPVLLACLMTMLMGRPVLELAAWGTGVALVGSTVWTWFQLNKQIVEIRFQDGRVAMISAWKSTQVTPRLAWERALDLRINEKGVRAIVGHTTYDLTHAEWAQLDEIVAHLRTTQP
jgi:hypothetical protein